MTLSRLLVDIADAYWLDKVRAENQLEAQRKGFEQRNVLMDKARKYLSGFSGRPSAPVYAPNMSTPQITQQAPMQGLVGQADVPQQADNQVYDESYSPNLSASSGGQIASAGSQASPYALMQTKPVGSFLDKLSPGALAEYAARVSGNDSMFSVFANNRRALDQSRLAGEYNLLGKQFDVEHPKPTKDILNYEYSKNDPEFFKKMLELKAASRPSTNVNVNMAKPLSVSDAMKLVDPETGAHPKPGTPLGEVVDKYVVASEASQKDSRNAAKALDVLDTLEELQQKAWSGKFGDSTKLTDRVKDTWEANYQQYVQDNPDLASYDDFASGTVSRLIRSMGEAGALSDSDVKRALALVPKMTPVPDTEEVAKHKIKLLREILQSASDVSSAKRVEKDSEEKSWNPGDGPEPGLWWED